MDALIEQIIADTNHRRNPYFVALADGTFAVEDFIETQIQFYFAVVFFSRPMAAVAAKIPSARLRREVLRNVWEEHGEGEEVHQHGSTFLAFLHRLGGIGQEELQARPLWPEVRQFNTVLTGATVMDEYLVGVGVMGMIEHMFADISSILGQGVLARGFLAEDQIIHYHLHEKLDIRHARDFFNVLLPAWESSEDDRYYIEQGLRLGAHCFYTLYDGLYRARHRRWRRSSALPHLRT